MAPKRKRNMKNTRINRKKKSKKRRLDLNANQEEVPIAAEQPRTVELLRLPDETVAIADDEQIIEREEANDEFADIYSFKSKPKILITSSLNASPRSIDFIKDLLLVFRHSEFYPRRGFELKTIIDGGIERTFTDIIIINEDRKKIHSMQILHLPNGPSLTFRLSSIKLCKAIPNHGNYTNHWPELVLNNFTTRLGRRVARQLGALFDPHPDFYGRIVASFTHARNFLFFRCHRYIFREYERGQQHAKVNDESDSKTNESEEGKSLAVKTRMQELGPRFTLKLRHMQSGLLDGKYEWIIKKGMETNRKIHYL